MRYFSLFSGIGGFELGIEQAYVESIDRKTNGESETDTKGHDEKRKRLESKKGKGSRPSRRRSDELSDRGDDARALTCVGYSEIDKHAIQIYEHHYPRHWNYGDITNLQQEELPHFDFLVGGFPCQSFSIAGKRGGFNDTRGTLFFDILRILRARSPRNVLLENVKGLLSHDNGRTFKTVIASLDELGYDLQWQVLNSKDFGVPQNRERVFIVGHLRGTPRPEVFPIVGTLENDIKQINNPTHSNDRIYEEDGISPTLNTMQGVMRQPFIAKTVRTGGRSSPHGSKQNWDSYEFAGRIRRLTPLECERLQGFPDGWTEGISDSQRYKCLGNAVTVNVVRAIMKKIL